VIDIPLAFVAGLLTLINPCVLPVIPVALASAASSNRLGPVALAAGMSTTFTVLGVAMASLGPVLGLTPDMVARVGALTMVLFGLVLVVPIFGEMFATATAGVAGSANMSLTRLERDGLGTQLLGGALLGAVWSPCVGPTLGGAIALASQGSSLVYAGTIMLAFSLGISAVVLALAYGTREAVRTRRDSLRALAARSKPLIGSVFILVGLFVFFGLHHRAEAALLEALPIWLQDLSVRF
jgi:cytochrome c-type biogenesis protein